MNISHLDNLKLKNIEPTIINIINEYKDSIEREEIAFFQNLPDYIDERYLNSYYKKDFSPLFNEGLDIQQKIHALNELGVEIYDIKNNVAITIKLDPNKHKYRWDMFKSKKYETEITSTPIRHFKHYLLVHDNHMKRNSRNNIITYTLDEVIEIATSKAICLHCITKDYMLQSIEENEFMKELKEKLV